jgi:hypothetical protein
MKSSSHKMRDFTRTGRMSNWTDRDMLRTFIRTGHIVDRRGFDSFTGINMHTHTRYDPRGFDITKRHGVTGTWWNELGFNFLGKHKVTKTILDPYGFNWQGVYLETETYLDPEGYDVHGLNPDGFKRNGIHLATNTIYDPEGFNREGLNKFGFDRRSTRLHLRRHLLSFRMGLESQKADESNLVTHKRTAEEEALHFWG